MKLIITVLIVSTCLAASTCAIAENPRARLVQVAGNHHKYAEQANTLEPIPARMLEPASLLGEIRAVMDSTHHAEQALREEFGANQSPALTRRMGELKKSSRMRILQIQLKYAQKEGRTELERRIRTSMEDLQRPAAPGEPRPNGRATPAPVVRLAEKPTGGSRR